MSGAVAALAGLWAMGGGEPSALARVTLRGDDPVLPTDFRIGTAASAAIAAGALAADELRRRRTGRGQQVSVDMRAAVAASRSERYRRGDGQPPPDVRGAIFGFYRTGDERWVQIHGALPPTARRSSASSAPRRRGRPSRPRWRSGPGRRSR